ncbi:hypothetical protein ONE63_008063 [Megalurothrips usitatus]|uniref:Glucose-methanol-choline oxidoreductase N-terminal domain-containing protein n=1 Tax=Megalurothrips usitatus TaxID=439358 RepID=A0AAV7XQI9_9NEOP|nr:hypothetical protein ONE63_008063 [Megalurothrips usitatus]
MQAAMEDAGAAPRADINAEGQLGQQVVQTTTANGERWSTYRSYLEPALRRRNLRVVTFATATRVLFDDKDRAEEGAVPRAVGVEYRDAAGKIRVARARREVVVSAGAIHSPQLLLLSGVGPAEELQAAKVPVVADLPGVGRNLQDHPVVDAVEYACAPPLCNVGWTDHKKDLAEYLLARRGPLSAAGMLQLVTFLRSDLAEPPAAGAPAKQPDLQMAFTNTLDDNGTRCMRLDQWRFNRIKVMPALLRPRSRGSVRLNAADPQGPPAVTLGYFTDPDGHDLGVMVRGLRFGRKLQSSLREHGVRLTTSPDAGAECR